MLSFVIKVIICLRLLHSFYGSYLWIGNDTVTLFYLFKKCIGLGSADVSVCKSPRTQDQIPKTHVKSGVNVCTCPLLKCWGELETNGSLVHGALQCSTGFSLRPCFKGMSQGVIEIHTWHSLLASSYLHWQVHYTHMCVHHTLSHTVVKI